MRRYSRSSGIGDLIPASGEGRALVEVKGRIGGKGAGMRRYPSRHSAERRFRNPVNYASWPVTVNADSTVEVATDKWYLMDINTNDSPGVIIAASFFPDTAMAIRYGSLTTSLATNDQVPLASPQRVPLNARPLWTTGEIRLNQRTAETILWKVALFRVPLDLPLSAASSVEPSAGNTGTADNQFPWFWQSQMAQDAARGTRPRNRDSYLPLWSRTFALQPNYNGGTNMASRTLKVRLRHKTGESFSTDNTGLALLIGTRSRGGYAYEDGGDYNINLRTSYVV